MARIRVNSVVYKLLSGSFFLLCLSGLLFQDTTISVNYFAFQVVTTIKLIQPEDVKYEKYINWCFRSDEMYNITGYDRLTMGERMAMAMNPGEMFRIGGTLHPIAKENASVYLNTPKSICFQIAGTPIILFGAYARRVTIFEIMLSNHVPDVDANRFHPHVLNTENDISALVTLTSYDYYVHKLKYPYTDNCFNYAIEGYYDNFDAINYCYNQRTGGNVLNNVNIYSSDSRYFNSTVGSYNESVHNDCSKLFYRSDCDRNVTYTRSSLTTIGTGLSVTYCLKLSSQDPSFVIQSKEKIDLIDYVSFILGTFGTWLGISFLSLNPIPRLFVVNQAIVPIMTTKRSNDAEQKNSTENRIKSLEREVAKLQLLSQQTRITQNVRQRASAITTSQTTN